MLQSQWGHRHLRVPEEAMRVRPWYEKDVVEARQQQRRRTNEFAVIRLKGVQVVSCGCLS